MPTFLLRPFFTQDSNRCLERFASSMPMHSNNGDSRSHSISCSLLAQASCTTARLVGSNCRRRSRATLPFFVFSRSLFCVVSTALFRIDRQPHCNIVLCKTITGRLPLPYRNSSAASRQHPLPPRHLHVPSSTRDWVTAVRWHG